MRALVSSALLLGLLFVVLLGLSCTYAPDLQNGALQCGDDSSCPKGYACASDGLCWKNGQGPGDVGPTLDDFVGTWTFVSGSLLAACSDGPPTTTALAGDFIEVTRSGATLLAGYYCIWTLNLPAGSDTATAGSGQSCEQDVPDTTSGVTFTYAWTESEFSFTTADGLSATVTGHVTGPYTATNGASGTCDGMFSGSLTLSAL